MVMRTTFEDWHGGVRIGGRLISNLRYADDTTILATSKQELKNGLERLKTVSESAGLFLNPRKTKVLSTGHLNSFMVNDGPVEVVKSAVFLGV